MNVIHRLPENLSNRIAAGEVVERPSSVVKELVENAIDAGATFVTIELERAGSRRISVSDDGCGMSREDALLAFEPHATSKILTEEDIDNIVTLGFRGEALPSIASVAQVELTTRRRSDESGTVVSIHGGALLAHEPAGRGGGTTVEVRELFYNVPARKKFLKTAATEEGRVLEAVTALALVNYQVGFVLRFDRRTVLSTPPERKWENRLRVLLGASVMDRMVAVNAEVDDWRVSGWISRPEFTRNTRRDERCFVNGRIVDSLAIYRGVKIGYDCSLEAGRYPVTVLLLELPVGEFDINVHPTKREVRFSSEERITELVAEAVRRTLKATPAPELQFRRMPEVPLSAVLSGAMINYDGGAQEAGLLFGGEEQTQVTTSRSIPVQERTIPEVTQPEVKAIISEKPIPVPLATTVCKCEKTKPETFAEPNRDSTPELRDDYVEKIAYQAQERVVQLVDAEVERTVEQYTKVPEEPVNKPGNLWNGGAIDTPDYEYLGIFAGTFILASQNDQLLIIDQHAAHERVMYEKLLHKFQMREAAVSQPLLLPLTLELSRGDALLVKNLRGAFQLLGFEVNFLSGNTVMVGALPAALPGDLDLERLFSDLLGQMTGNNALKLLPDTEALARAACHAAVKAHDQLSELEVRSLLKDLGSCERPDCCPHGRPTVIRIERRYLERKFGRSPMA